MTFDEYQKQAEKTNGQVTMMDKILNGTLSLAGESGELIRLLNGALGLPAEVGDVVEIVKKWKYHGKHLDANALMSELGDVLWSISSIASGLGVSLNDVAKMNNEKLAQRYPNGFTHGGGVR